MLALHHFFSCESKPCRLGLAIGAWLIGGAISCVSGQSPSSNCLAQFTTSLTNCPIIDFQDASIAASSPVFYNWQFGDSTTSPAANPSHTYAANGTYTVCLDIMVNFSCTSRICADVVVECLPLSISPSAQYATAQLGSNPPQNGRLQLIVASPIAGMVQGTFFSIDGRPVQTWTLPQNAGQQQHVLPCELATGMYLLRVHLPDGATQTLRVVQQAD